MKIPSLRLIAALFAFMFVAAACASDSGVQWTFAPVPSSDTSEATSAPGASEGPAASPGGNGDTGVDATPAPGGGIDGSPGTPEAPRIIELQLTGALQITDASGNRVQDIPVVPGETVTFVVENVAGFDHNFYIGTEAEVSGPAATTPVGIADWSTGVQELTWTVPDDVDGLQFACTVPGHYTLMHGTFSAADGGGEPQPPAESMAPEASMAPADVPVGDAGVGTVDAPRVIDLEATASLQFAQAGAPVRDIPVTPGETVVFRINNTANFVHNMYVGTEAELSVPSAVTDIGIPDWSTGVQELVWTVPEDIEGLKFGCTVPGHYALMQGTFSVADGTAEPQAAAAPSEPPEPAAPSESPAPAAPSEPPEAAASVAPGSAGTADKRVINLEATAALQFTQDGEQIRDIPVTPGETVVIRVDNTAGFAHNFYIGTEGELSSPNGTTDVGIPDWDTGVQFVEWQVPADVTDLKFGCTVPGHYTLMQGTISTSP